MFVRWSRPSTPPFARFDDDDDAFSCSPRAVRRTRFTARATIQRFIAIDDNGTKHVPQTGLFQRTVSRCFVWGSRRAVRRGPRRRDFAEQSSLSRACSVAPSSSSGIVRRRKTGDAPRCEKKKTHTHARRIPSFASIVDRTTRDAIEIHNRDRLIRATQQNAREGRFLWDRATSVAWTPFA